MKTRRGLVVVGGLVLGALAWWALQGDDEAAPGSAAVQGSRTAPETAPDRADRRPLPTRTEADEVLERPEALEGTRAPRSPDDRPHVTCQLSEAVAPLQGALYMIYGQQEILVDSPTASGRQVSFLARERYRIMVLHLPGYAPVTLQVDAEGGCSPEPLLLSARAEQTLSGRVVNTAGNPEPDARIWGCGPARIDGEGRFTVRPVKAPCDLRAARQDGFWFSKSEWVSVAADPGGHRELELVLDEYPRGGIGIGIAQHDLGVRVSDVHAGSPGEQAGLAAGELILAVDGEPSADMDLDTFVDRATGEAGTDVSLTVLGLDGTEREVTLTRAMLGP